MARLRSMEEFARASGVSRPTLAKFFMDRTSVRQSTRERIERALSEHDYRPNLFAVSQNRRRPRNIAVLVPYLSDPFFAELVRQIETRCLALGFWVIVLSSHADPGAERTAVETMLSLRLAGAVVAPLGSDLNRASFETLAASIPLVLLDSWIDLEAPFVGTDNDASIDLLVRYLVSTGEAPCYLDMPAMTRNAVDRRNAFAVSAAKAGFEPRVLAAEAPSWDFEQMALDLVGAHLARGSLPSRTILCANDRLAFGALSAACRAGLRVGRAAGSDLRVAGHDDHPLSRFACPALTTVAQDFDRLAGTALDILLRRLDGEEPTSLRTTLPARLVTRQSA